MDKVFNLKFLKDNYFQLTCNVCGKQWHLPNKTTLKNLVGILNHVLKHSEITDISGISTQFSRPGNPGESKTEGRTKDKKQ